MGHPAEGAGVVRQEPQDPSTRGRWAPQEDFDRNPGVDEHRQKFEHIDVEKTDGMRLKAHWLAGKNRKPRRLEVSGRETPFKAELNAKPPPDPRRRRL